MRSLRSLRVSTQQLCGGLRQLCSRATKPRWTNEMATPHTGTHAREQTRRDEQAHKNGDAARAGVEKLVNFRQRATDDAWKSMESGIDTASQEFQNASDQFTRALGFSGEEGERLARQSRQNAEERLFAVEHG